MEGVTVVEGRNSSADSLARFVITALFALVPLFFIPAAWASIAQSKMMIVAICVILATLAWLIARAATGSVHVPRSMLLYVTLLLPISYVISAAVSGWNPMSLVGQGVEQDTVAAVALWYAIFALSSFLMAGNPGLIRASLRTLMIGASVLFLFQIIHTLFPQVTLGGLLAGQTTNFFGSWHDLGIFAGLIAFCAGALWNSSFFAGLWRYCLIAAGFTAVLLLLLIHYADVFWGLTALSLLAYALVVRTALRADVSLIGALKQGVLWGVAAIVCGLLAFFSAQFAGILPERIAITEVEVRPSWQGTFDVGKQTLSAPTSLVFGTGPNSFIKEWAQHKPAGVNTTPFWESDFNFGVGIIPTSLFTAGLFGAIAWGAIVLVFLALILKAIRETRPLVTGRLLFVTLLAGTGFLLAFHMMYTPGSALTALTFLMLGVLSATVVGDASPQTIRIGLKGIGEVTGLLVAIVLAAIVFLAAGFVVRENLSNLYVNRAAIAYRVHNDAGAAGDHISTALTISPKNDRAHRAAAELGVIELARLIRETEAQNSEDVALLQQTLQNTIQHGLSAVAIDGSNYQNWLLLAQVYSNFAGANIDGALEAASEAYRKAFEANPTNPTPKLRLAQLAVAREDRAAARTYLDEAIALKPDFAAAHYLRSQVEAAEGNAEGAIAAAAQTVQLVPQEPVAWFNLGYLLYATGNYRDAALALQQAAVLNPEYANALFILALTYNALKMPDDAGMVLERVRELNPTETWISQMIQNIKAGKEPFTGIQTR